MRAVNDDAPSGYIKLARRVFDERVGDRAWLEPRVFSRWEAWVDMIQLACFAPYRHATQFGVIDLERGEFVRSRRSLAMRWQWSEKKVRTWIAILQKRAQLRAQRETGAGTVYLIVNYDTYQGAGPEDGPPKGPHKGPAGAQQGPKREEDKERTTKTTTAATPDEQRVLEHYRATHPRRRLTDKSLRIVRKALSLGYSPDELCEAITGNASSQWHSEKGKHELSFVLRDEEHIDGFRLNAEPVQAIIDETGCLTAYGERLTRPT